MQGTWVQSLVPEDPTCLEQQPICHSTYIHALESHSFRSDTIFVGPYFENFASLVAQRVKHLPTMWETRVRPLGQEDPLEKEMATHSSSLENSMDREAWWSTVCGVTKSQTRLSDFTFFHFLSQSKWDGPQSPGPKYG